VGIVAEKDFKRAELVACMLRDMDFIDFPSASGKPPSRPLSMADRQVSDIGTTQELRREATRGIAVKHYFFSPAAQFDTTVNTGADAGPTTTVSSRKRLPSAVRSYWNVELRGVLARRASKRDS
jgi:hypothetical protein